MHIGSASICDCVVYCVVCCVLCVPFPLSVQGRVREWKRVWWVLFGKGKPKKCRPNNFVMPYSINKLIY